MTSALSPARTVPRFVPGLHESGVRADPGNAFSLYASIKGRRHPPATAELRATGCIYSPAASTLMTRTRITVRAISLGGRPM